MNYILCEGSDKNSDYAFCMHILELYNIKGIVKSSYGNRGIKREFNNMFEQFKEGDNFILFFDKVAEIKDIPVDSILEMIKIRCIKKGVNFWYSSYYSMEELFLSYIGFKELLDYISVSKMNNEYKAIVKEISERILNNGNYYLEMDNKKILKHLETQNITTREECSKALCYEITPKIKNRFKITKAYIGDCWLKSCTDICDSVKCSECKYICANNDAEEKMDSLCANSIAKYGIPFSSLKVLQ